MGPTYLHLPNYVMYIFVFRAPCTVYNNYSECDLEMLTYPASKLIYLDEIMNDNLLLCVSSSQTQVGWHSAGPGLLVSTTSIITTMAGKNITRKDSQQLQS